MKEFLKKMFFGEMMTCLFLSFDVKSRERLTPVYFRWLNGEVPKLASEFIQQEKILESSFVRGLNKTFHTGRFDLFFSRCILEYFIKVCNLLNDSLAENAPAVILEDNPLHRFVFKKFMAQFGVEPKVQWRRDGYLKRLLQIIFSIIFCLGFSLKNGLRLRSSLQNYTLLREAVWGLYDIGGYYFHDDFLVDGEKIKKESLLLFSRSLPKDHGRRKGYEDAQRSPYTHFNLKKLSLGLKPFLNRIIPKYIWASHGLLLREMRSGHFFLFRGIFLYFAFFAIAYERIFSHYRVTSELGHNYFSANHIAEAIVCENYGTRYYLMHWSDFSVESNRWVASYLGCDKYLTWGKIHVKGVTAPYVPTGYVFKRFILEIARRKRKVLDEMGLPRDRKIIVFFDEMFGEVTELKPQHFVNLWESAYRCAVQNPEAVVVIKPKDIQLSRYLPEDLRQRFDQIRRSIDTLTNFYILDEKRYCFVEAVGVADIVVTEGMTSSATIAIVCGIEGLYLNEVGYDHPFARQFKDKVVFDTPNTLLLMIKKILQGEESPRSLISQELLREYDEYQDDKGIDRFREILAAGA